MATIEKTLDYDQFIIREDNRDVSDNSVEGLMKAIKENNLTEYSPVIVNEDFEVIDGQHQLQACVRLGYPVYYIKAKLNGKSEEAMITLNANSKNWKLKDYIKHYSTHEGEQYDDYRYLAAFKKKHQIPLTQAICIVANKTYGMTKEIRSGEFKQGASDPEITMNILKDYRPIFTFAYKAAFVKALMQVVRSGLYDHTFHYLKMEKNKKWCREQTTKEQYIQMFEQYINSGRVRKNYLRF